MSSFLGGLLPTPGLDSLNTIGANAGLQGGMMDGLFPDDSALGQLFNAQQGRSNGASSMTKIISNVGAYGIIPNNRFRMEFTAPATLGEQIDNERLSVACEELTLPGVSVGTTDYTTQGPPTQMPYEYIYSQSLDMTFRLSDNMYERDIWQKWLKGIINPTSGIMSFYDDFTGSVDLILVDDTDADVYKWKVQEVFVKQVGPVSVSQSNEGYAVQQVTFAFRRFDTELMQTNLASGLQSPAGFSLPPVAQNGGLLGEINDMTGGLSGAVINNYGTMLNDLF